MYSHDNDLKKRATTLFIKGLGYKAVAYTLKLSVYTVRDWKRLYRLHGDEWYLIKRDFGITPGMRDAAVQMHREGVSILNISETFNIRRETIRHWIRHAAA